MAFHKLKLNQVFGISPNIPEHTYVDRNNLDQKFNYLVDSGSHLVIHGASKQGKTVLRRKNLPDKKCIKVQCTNRTDIGHIYSEIIRQAKVKIPTEVTNQFSGSAEGKGTVPGFELKGGLNVGKQEKHGFQGFSLDNINYIAEVIQKTNKKVVIEDFHYLSTEIRKKLSFDLKVFWDCSVSFIIMGVWSEDNILSYYNGDLSGRIEEIDVRWKNEELEKVLEMGERKLQISFSDKIKKSILDDSNGNVGLLQFIAGKVCLASGITDNNSRSNRTISNINSLGNCRLQICKDLVPRYRLFSEKFSRGFKNEATQPIYESLLNICMKASDEELRLGIHKDIIGERLKHLNIEVNSPLSNYLKRIDNLQSISGVSPIVLSYNTDSQKVQLVDYDLLFFRKYIG